MGFGLGLNIFDKIKVGLFGSIGQKSQGTVTNNNYYHEVPVPHPNRLGYTKDIRNLRQGTNNIFSALFNLTQALRRPEKMNFDLPRIRNDKDAFNYSVKNEADKSFMNRVKGAFLDFINMDSKINFMKNMMAKQQYMQLANKKGGKNQQSNPGFNLFNPFRFF